MMLFDFVVIERGSCTGYAEILEAQRTKKNTEPLSVRRIKIAQQYSDASLPLQGPQGGEIYLNVLAHLLPDRRAVFGANYKWHIAAFP